MLVMDEDAYIEGMKASVTGTGSKNRNVLMQD